MISVVMITKNEEAAVGQVIRDIRSAQPDAEILLVDSSVDRTAQIAEGLGAKVIRQVPPKGYGPAMDLALRSASGEIVVTLDCDNSYPAHKIPEIVQVFLAGGHDLLDCSRLRTKPDAMPWINYFANIGFAWIASVLFWRRLTDLHSGMRVYRKAMLDKMVYNPQGAALPVELLLRPIKMGFKVHCVFIDYRERIGQSTMRPLESAYWTIKRILRVRFS